LGIDPGERRIGVALSDETRLLATPLVTILRTSWTADVGRLAELVRQYDVAAVVIGHPLTTAGEVGQQARRAQRLAERVAAAIAVPVELCDERYSTAEAADLMRMSPPARRRGEPSIDSAAAAVMLQRYLDSRR
jgi:putative Holliday junction resolvase